MFLCFSFLSSLFLALSLSASVCFFLSLYLSLSLSVFLALFSFCFSLSVSISVCLCLCLTLSLSLSVCLCRSVCLPLNPLRFLSLFVMHKTQLLSSPLHRGEVTTSAAEEKKRFVRRETGSDVGLDWWTERVSE